MEIREGGILRHLLSTWVQVIQNQTAAVHWNISTRANA